jgi:hypothetical protein
MGRDLHLASRGCSKASGSSCPQIDCILDPTAHFVVPVRVAGLCVKVVTVAASCLLSSPCHTVGCIPVHRLHALHEQPPENAPASATPPVMTNAWRELPLICTISPVTQGATIPQRLANPFCKLLHRPAISVPANVCDRPVVRSKGPIPHTCHSNHGDRAG